MKNIFIDNAQVLIKGPSAGVFYWHILLYKGIVIYVNEFSFSWYDGIPRGIIGWGSVSFTLFELGIFIFDKAGGLNNALSKVFVKRAVRPSFCIVMKGHKYFQNIQTLLQLWSPFDDVIILVLNWQISHPNKTTLAITFEWNEMKLFDPSFCAS